MNTIMKAKPILFVALATAAILMIPLIAMQFTAEVNWTLSDFVAMGILVSGTGLLYVLFSSMVKKKKHRIAIGLGLAVAFLWLWAELAVGVFTNWGS